MWKILIHPTKYKILIYIYWLMHAICRYVVLLMDCGLIEVIFNKLTGVCDSELENPSCP